MLKRSCVRKWYTDGCKATKDSYPAEIDDVLHGILYIGLITPIRSTKSCKFQMTKQLSANNIDAISDGDLL